MSRQRDHDVHACRLAASGDFHLPGAQDHYPPDLSVEPRHTEIDLAVDIEARVVEGAVTHTLVGRRAGAQELTLHAVAFEDVDLSDGDGRPLRWSYDGREISVSWPDAFAAGEERRLRVTYRVSQPTGGVYFASDSAANPGASAWAATDHETEKARHWLPCVDLPNVRTTLQWKLRAKSDYTILANGISEGETDHGDGTKTACWRLDQPCPSYLTCFCLGDLTRADDGEHAGLEVAYFGVRAFTADDLRRSFGRTRDMLDWMSKKLGMAFPFPKYYQFALPGFGGAMENISLVSWDDCFVLDENLASEWTWLVDQVNVHEMAHSYFGDHVVCRDFSHAWLKESWATYMETCWLEDSKGADEQRYDLWVNARRYFEEADDKYKRPIVTRKFNSSWQMYDRHLYPGGATRLHTLRCELGDDVFWNGVQDYLQRYAGKVVETDDFRRVLEEHSGRSLGRFFDQWFRSAGYPHLKVTFSHDLDTGQGTFEVDQAQVDEKAGVGAFELTLDLGWVVDGKLQTRRVQVQKASHSFVVDLGGKPEQVRVDPHGQLLHKLELNPGDGMLRTQLRDAPDVTGRIQAACELAKAGSAANVAAIGEAWRQEEFWGVRVEMAQALSKLGTAPAVALLAELIGEERDPLVLESLVRAASSHRDAAIRTALAKLLDSDVTLYRARAAALEGLGAQREDAPLDVLEAAARREGFGGIEQAGAFRALGACRQEAALEVLLAQVGPGACSNRSRPAAVAALGVLGRVSERPARERIGERLEDLLRDPVQRVRQAALGALGKLGEGRAMAALEGYRGPLPAQEQVSVDGVVAGLRAAGGPAKDDKRVEDLEARLRKLEERLEKLDACRDA